MSEQRGGPVALPDGEAPAVMDLLAEGVPLDLLVDIAMPAAMPRDSQADAGRAGSA